MTSYLVHGPEYTFAIAKQRYELVDPRRVAIHPTNPKRHDIGAITESIGENTFMGGIILLEHPLVLFDVALPEGFDHWVIAGAGRVKTSLAMGAQQIPALIADVDSEKAEAMLLADNEAARKGGHDEAMLLNAISARIAKYEGDVMRALKGTTFAPDDVDDLIAHIKAAESSAMQTPFATFDEKKTPIDPNKFVAFHFGDMHGYVARDLYERFKTTYHDLRKDGATTNASGPAMMDDVLRVWLKL